MSTDTKITIGLVAAGWVVLSTTWHWFSARVILRKWARANGFELVNIDMNWFGTSPFIFTSKHQEVYRFRVRDHRGRERSGWARCGGFWLGFLVDKVEVEWNK